MPHVLQRRQDSHTKAYLRIGDRLELVCDPMLATAFDTAGQATAMLGQVNGSMLEFDPVPQEQARRDYAEWLQNPVVGWFAKKSPLSRPYRGEGRDAVLRWWWDFRHADENTVSYEDYKTWPRLSSLFQHLCEVDRFDIPGTTAHERLLPRHTYSFRMRVNADSTFATFAEELNRVLPMVSHCDTSGAKVIAIFDHCCGEGGDFAYFKALADGRYAITGRRTAKIESADLREIFEYWRKHRWYEGGEE